MQRRQFLAAGAAALAGGLAPSVLVGSGEHTYECWHDWLVPPAHIVWGDTQGVAEDAQGNLYVAHTVHPTSPCDDAIVVFDKNGKFLSSWGPDLRGGAHGIEARAENGSEFLYHCDTVHRRVRKTTLDGTIVWEIGAPVEPGVYKDGAPFVPTNVAFAPGGDLFVADGYGSHWIHRYTKEGEWRQTFGGKGTERGKFQTPHGLWLDERDTEPRLVVTDRASARLQYLSLNGKPVGSVPQMRRPCHCRTRNGLVLVPDLSSVVTILDEHDKVVARLGDGDPSKLRNAPRDQFIPGRFVHPHDARFLQNGDILVAEWVPIGRLTRLRRKH